MGTANSLKVVIPSRPSSSRTFFKDCITGQQQHTKRRVKISKRRVKISKRRVKISTMWFRACREAIAAHKMDPRKVGIFYDTILLAL
jgi:3-oxoacyl-[acyl-carrier-protein] synthase III